MEHYDGQRARDKIRGGGAYVKRHGRGHEVCNFSRVGDTLYGYAQPPKGTKRLNLKRLGAGDDDESVDGVTIVWTAFKEKVGTVIVGWYTNATVYRHYQKFDRVPLTQARNEIDGYWFSAPAGAKPLPVDERIFEIPRGKGGMGMSNIWYADKPENAALVRRVAAFIRGGRIARKAGSLRRCKQDQERKARVEKIAIKTCCKHFENLGYEIKDTQKDNCGWDLEAKSGRSTLRIEVKGLSGSEFSVELTPNEFLAFSQERDDYRLVVVTNALDRPLLFICRHSKEEAGWVVDGHDRRCLEIQIRQSASIKSAAR